MIHDVSMVGFGDFPFCRNPLFLSRNWKRRVRRVLLRRRRAMLVATVASGRVIRTGRCCLGRMPTGMTKVYSHVAGEASMVGHFVSFFRMRKNSFVSFLFARGRIRFFLLLFRSKVFLKPSPKSFAFPSVFEFDAK